MSPRARRRSGAVAQLQRGRMVVVAFAEITWVYGLLHAARDAGDGRRGALDRDERRALAPAGQWMIENSPGSIPLEAQTL
jgi:hypothetical protein